MSTRLKRWRSAGCIALLLAGAGCAGRGRPETFRLIELLGEKNIISSPLTGLVDRFPRREHIWRGEEMTLLEGGARKTWAVSSQSRLLIPSGSLPDGMDVNRNGGRLDHGLESKAGGWDVRRVEEKIEPERVPGFRRYRGAVLLPAGRMFTSRDFFSAQGELLVDILASSRDGMAYLPIMEVYLDDTKIGEAPVCTYQTYRFSHSVEIGYHRLSIVFKRHLNRGAPREEILLLLDRIQISGSNDLILISSPETAARFKSGRFRAKYSTLPTARPLDLPPGLKPGQSVEIPVRLDPGLNRIDIITFQKNPGTFLKVVLDDHPPGLRRLRAWQRAPHRFDVSSRGGSGRLRFEWVVPDPGTASRGGEIKLAEARIQGPEQAVWNPLYQIRHDYPILDNGIESNPLGIKKKLVSGDKTLNALFAPPGTLLRFDLRIPDQAVLRCGWSAYDPLLLSSGRRVRFLVELETDGENHIILDETASAGPASDAIFRPEGPIDLSRFAGRRVRVTLSTEPVPSESINNPAAGKDPIPAFWINPVIDRSSRPEDGNRPNIILISIDTLRADHLGCYGYKRDTSPAIDALSRDSLLFRRFYSHSPSTLPSHMSMLTGLYPSRHGLLNLPLGGAVSGQSLNPATPILADLLRETGYATAAFTGGAQMSGIFGYSRGFDSYQENRGAIAQDTAPVLYEKASTWVNRHQDHPFFLFLHTYQVHAPYLPPAEYAERFLEADAEWKQADLFKILTEREGKYSRLNDAQRKNLIALYDAEIRYLDDAFIRPFLLRLKELDLYDRSLIVLTSDHGDEFGEHRGWEHGHSLYNELIHVPLIIKRPSLSGAGTVVDGVSRMIDLMPTILEEAGMDPGKLDIDGRGLRPMWESASDAPRVSAGYRFHAAVEGKDRLTLRYLLLNTSLIDGDRKLIVNEPYPDMSSGGPDSFWRISPPPFPLPDREFFDLAEDPGEIRNRIDKAVGPASRLMETLRAFISAGKEAARITREARASTDKQMEERLRALGYIK